MQLGASRSQAKYPEPRHYLRRWPLSGSAPENELSQRKRYTIAHSGSQTSPGFIYRLTIESSTGQTQARLRPANREDFGQRVAYRLHVWF